jgi:hypothetical protein
MFYCSDSGIEVLWECGHDKGGKNASLVLGRNLFGNIHLEH